MRTETAQQRRIVLTVIWILIAGIGLVLVSQLVTAAPPSRIVAALVGLVAAVLLLIAHSRDWKYTRHTTVAFFTLLAAASLPEPYVTSQVSFAVLIPPVLALMVVSPIWVVASAVVVMAGILLRAQGTSAYADPVMLVLFAMVIGGMILARLVVDAAQQAAETQAQRAEQALAQSEQRSRELEEATVLMEQQLDQQQELLNLVTTLETPAVPLAEGVLFAPIVGHVDTRRAQLLTSRLLEEASSQRARLVVLDITGVSVMDTAVAKSLLNTAQALRLLGCEVTLSGISATVAMTLIQLGVNLKEVRTARSPQEALAQYLGSVPLSGKITPNNKSSYN
jgi:rsbT co-antagonist protein RsbR